MKTEVDSLRVKRCRLCKSHDVKAVLELRDSALCDAYLNVEESQTFYPLILNRCKKCDFIQLGHVVPPEIIYEDYLYFTESSPGLDVHFKEYSNTVMSTLQLGRDNLIVDIGSNDGTLLKHFMGHNQRVLGIEPSVSACRLANARNIKTYNAFFDQKLVKLILKTDGKVDLITINNLFANVVDLNKLLDNVGDLLADSGVLIIESSYLFSMLDNMVFDFIYHEHISYLSVKPLKEWFSKNGFKLFNIEQVDTKGGSLRYFVGKEKSKWKVRPSVKEIERAESTGRNLEQKFFDFRDNINRIKLKCDSFLSNYHKKRIVGYGASATSTTLISHLELQSYLTYLVDDNQAKVGRFSPGHHIPVFGPERLIVEEPDLIIILAWRFFDQIYPKIRGIGVPVIIPLPNFDVVEF